MTMGELVETLGAKGVELWFEGDRLRFRASEGCSYTRAACGTERKKGRHPGAPARSGGTRRGDVAPFVQPAGIVVPPSTGP